MLLTQENLCYYLLERKLLDQESLMNGDFMAIPAHTRNNIFKVITLKGPLFIKQVTTFDAHAVSVLEREAKAYHFISSHGEYASLNAVIPSFIDYDKDRHVLVVRYFMDHASVHEYYFQQQRVLPDFSAAQASVMGSYHFPVPAGADTHAFPKQLPWILKLDAYTSGYSQHANGTLMGMIQGNAELRGMMGALKDEWVYTSLIHGDIKWTNFITPAAAKDASDMKLVDWEIADIGDPCWDVAGLLQSFLSTWIFGFDNQVPGTHHLQQNMQAFAIETTQPAAAHFWNTYSETMRFSPAESHAMLMKSIRYTAARMLQTSIEGVMQTPHVYPNNVRIVQAAFNILKSPETAAETLFGIPLHKAITV